VTYILLVSFLSRDTLRRHQEADPNQILHLKHADGCVCTCRSYDLLARRITRPLRRSAGHDAGCRLMQDVVVIG
jgi:hypothetical protein